MSTLDNIMTGRSLKIRSNFLTDALYWGFAQKEETAQRGHVEKIIDFLEIQAIRKTPVGKLRTACRSGWSWRGRWRWSPRCCCSTSRWRE